MRAVAVVAVVVSIVLSPVSARNPSTLREVRSTVADALDVTRDSDRRCRDDVLDLIKDANAAAQALRADDRRATSELERMLERAMRRAKDSCGKKVVRALDDALDALDALPRDGGGAPPAKPYEPTMQDVTNATTECGKQDRYEGDDKPCIDAVLALMRGPLRSIALQVPASCGRVFRRNDFRWCMEAAGKAKRSPVEVNEYCNKNTRYVDEQKKCIIEWTQKGVGGAADKQADPPKATKKFGETCQAAADCDSKLCMVPGAGKTGWCSARCNDEWDCTKLGGGFVHDWQCRTSGTTMPVCLHAPR